VNLALVEIHLALGSAGICALAGICVAVVLIALSGIGVAAAIFIVLIGFCLVTAAIFAICILIIFVFLRRRSRRGT